MEVTADVVFVVTVVLRILGGRRLSSPMLFKSGLLLRLKRSELWLSRMLTLVGFKSLFSAAHPGIMKNVLIASGLLQRKKKCLRT